VNPLSPPRSRTVDAPRRLVDILPIRCRHKFVRIQIRIVKQARRWRRLVTRAPIVAFRDWHLVSQQGASAASRVSVSVTLLQTQLGLKGLVVRGIEVGGVDVMAGREVRGGHVAVDAADACESAAGVRERVGDGAVCWYGDKCWSSCP